MNIEQLVPKEAREIHEKNQKYAEIIAQSYLSDRQRELVKKELRLAPTPKEIIYEESSLKLYRFTPEKKKLHPVPLIIVPSLILKYYVMDLLTGHSLIEHLVKSGIDTYLIDWGVPGEEHGSLTFDYYIETFIRRCVRRVSRLNKKKPVNMLGQCLGGTLAAVYTSLHQEQIANLVLLTTPVDFKDAGLLALWTDKNIFNVDKIVDSFGSVIPPDFIHACFQFLDVKATVERYKRLYKNVLDEKFLYNYRALDHWTNDKIPFPGEVFRKFIKELYQENLLVKGEFTINGRVADIQNITCPVLTIVAEFDHVFPEESAKAVVRLAGGPVEYNRIQAGHVTLITLFPQREETYALIEEFLKRE